MSTETSTSLRLTRVVKASRDKVFEAWTVPDHLRRWSCPEGAEVEDAVVDLRVGGRYRIRMRGAEGQSWTAFGEYREIDRPSKLAYTWDWEEKENVVGETLVTVEFNDLGGSTEIVLTHELFPNADAMKAHSEGWNSCLNRLERLLGQE